ncbi:hypothetical protein [Pedobacter heparinus]|uniref:hypothetical protein n=1 Tax=Pedobacter heparinus TaxID=984 RepID=UPI0029304C79|nr:hypothetical protein [Pedobacter heparinus]
MMIEVTPPIHERTTKQLLSIAGAPHKWQPRVVENALVELSKRGVDKALIQRATYQDKRADQFEALKKAKESFDYSDFIFHPIAGLIGILFSTNLKEDGYLRKAEQQRKFRQITGVILLIIISIAFICYLIATVF